MSFILQPGVQCESLDFPKYFIIEPKLETLKFFIEELSKVVLFEFNDDLTRAFFKESVNPFLDGIKDLGEIVDYQVVCDETNNTEEIVSNNQFIADIYYKKTEGVEFTILHLKVTKSEVSFDEVTAKF